MPTNFNVIAYSQMNYVTFKVVKPDACIRPLFATHLLIIRRYSTLTNNNKYKTDGDNLY